MSLAPRALQDQQAKAGPGWEGQVAAPQDSGVGSSPAPMTSPDGMSGLAWVALFTTINSNVRHTKPEEIKVA